MKKEDLQKMRIDLGFSQSQMADFTGVSLSYYSKMETGSKPISDKIEKKIFKIFEKSDKKSAMKKFPEDFLQSNESFTREDLIEIRENLGLSQDELSDMIGISRGYISHVEGRAGKITQKLSRKIRLFLAKHYAEGITSHAPKAAQNDANHHEGNPVCPQCGFPPEDHIHPTDVVEYQPREMIRTVNDNNEKLRVISLEIENMSKAMATFAHFDTIVQTKVDAIVSLRARQIIAVYNHHITAQARLMVNTLRNTVRVLKDGKASDECIIGILEDLAKQLELLKGYEPPIV